MIKEGTENQINKTYLHDLKKGDTFKIDSKVGVFLFIRWDRDISKAEVVQVCSGERYHWPGGTVVRLKDYILYED